MANRKDDMSVLKQIVLNIKESDNALIVQNLPDGVTDDSLENFLEVLCDGEIEDLHFFKDHLRTSLVVVFTEPVLDIVKVQKRTLSKKLERQIVDIFPLPASPDGIIVTNLDSTWTQSLLELYFERGQAGGEEDCIESCDVYMKLKLAVLVVKNPHSVVPRILGSKHELNDIALSVDPFYELFHSDMIQKLVAEETESPGSSLESSPRSSHSSTESSLDKKSTEENDNYQNSANFDTLDERHSDFVLDRGHTDRNCTEIAQNKDSFQNVRLKEGGNTPSSGHGKLKIFMSENSSHFGLRSLDRASPQRNDGSEPILRSLDRASPQRIDGSEPILRSLDRASPQRNDGSEPIRDSTKKINDNNSANHVSAEHYDTQFKAVEPQCISPPEQTEQRKINLTMPKLILLAMSKLQEEYPHCKMKFDIKSEKVTFEGKESDVQMLQFAVFKKLDGIINESWRLSKHSAKALEDKLKSSKQFFKNTMNTCHLQAYLSFSAESCNLSAMAFTLDQAKRALQKIRSMFEEEEIQYTESHIKYLQSPAWNTLKAKQKDQVHITVDKTQKRIIVVGNRDILTPATNVIKDGLSKNAVLTAKPITIDGGKAKFFKFCLFAEIKDIQKTVGSEGGKLEYKYEDNLYTVSVRGADDVVHNAERKIQQLKRDIWEGNVELSKISHKENYMTLMARGLNTSKGSEYLTSFGKKNSCFVMIRREKTQGTLLLSFKMSDRSSPTRESDRDVDRSSEKGATASYSHHRSSSMGAQVEHASRHTGYSSSDTSIHVGKSTITVKAGDISKEKAALLVNVLGKSRNLSETAVSKSYLRCGGKEFMQHFKNNDKGSEDVVMTPSCGALQCQHVCHMVLQKWDTDHVGKVKHFYRTGLQKVFDQMNSSGADSIAFPAVGNGRLLRYPNGYITEVLIEEAVRACHKYKIKNIAIVIYDDELRGKFVTRLQKEGAGSSTPTMKPRQDEPQRGPSEKRTHRPQSYEGRPEDSSGSQRSPIEILLYAKSREAGEKLRSKLSEEIKQWFLFKETKTNEKFKRLLQRGKMKEIYKKCKGKLVYVDDSKLDKGVLKVLGDQHAVSEVLKDIYSDLMETESHDHDERPRKYVPPKHQKGTQEYWKAMVEDPPAPHYWKHFQDGFGYKDYVKNIFKFPTTKVHGVSGKSFMAVKSLVEKTFNSSIVGQGKDAVGLSHTKLNVKAVELIENLSLYRDYANKRLECFTRLAKGHTYAKLESIVQTNKGPIVSSKHVDSYLLSDIYSEINEHYFFHGTDDTLIDNIANKGLDPRHGSDNGMFGPGIYGAESSTKADQYADDAKSRKTGDRKMLLIRLLLGDMFVSNNPQKFKMPPCTTCRKEKCVNPKHHAFDSVVGDGKWLFREFVVYEKQQCYAEYVITYDRV